MAADPTFKEKLQSLQFAGSTRKPEVFIDRHREGATDTKSVEILDSQGRSAGADIFYGDGRNDSHVVVHDPVSVFQED